MEFILPASQKLHFGEREVVRIPYEVSTETDKEDGAIDYNGKINTARGLFVKSLRLIPSVMETAAALSKDTLYKIVMAPEGAKLRKDVHGNVMGVWIDKGEKIAQHARLKEVGFPLMETGANLAIQALLINIAQKLDHIEKMVEGLYDEFRNDRYANIKSGIRQYEQAVKMVDSEVGKYLICNSISMLNEGLDKNILMLENDIKDLCKIDASAFYHYIYRSKEEAASEKINKIKTSFKLSISALRYLALCYLEIEELAVAKRIYEMGINEIYACGFDVIEEKARMLDYEDVEANEIYWSKFTEYAKKGIKGDIEMLNLIKSGRNVIEIEFKPEEILIEGNGADEMQILRA